MSNKISRLLVRLATEADLPLVAVMNRELIIDEGHRNLMTLAQLEERARGFLASGIWRIDVFEADRRTAGFATWREQEDVTETSGRSVFLRQFYITREMRGSGLGRAALDRLVSRCFPRNARIVLEVMQSNPGGKSFWSRMGFVPYASTLERLSNNSVELRSRI